MKTQKQQRLYNVLIALTVILLLVAQGLLLYTYKSATDELTSVRSQLVGQKKTQTERLTLVSEYQAFEHAASSPGRHDASFPARQLDLYTMVEEVMGTYAIEHTNTPESPGDMAPGSELRLRITFNGRYYNILKLLAAFRNTPYVIRISDFSLTGQDDGNASGSMIIVSRVQS
jgi:hypothetical protein